MNVSFSARAQREREANFSLNSTCSAAFKGRFVGIDVTVSEREKRKIKTLNFRLINVELRCCRGVKMYFFSATSRYVVYRDDAHLYKTEICKPVVHLLFGFQTTFVSKK